MPTKTSKTGPRSKPDAVKRTPSKRGASIPVDDFLKLKNPKGDVILNIDKQQLSLTNLDRIYWPDEKITKFDLLRYYLQMSKLLMPFLEGRPAILQRWPRGIKAPMFFQQDMESVPRFVKTIRLENLQGRELDYAVYTTTASLLHLVNLGTIEQHPWHSRINRLNKPDWIALDLDPKSAPWENVLQVALVAKEVCEEIGLEAFPKTSGSSGIHIYLPLKPTNDYEAVAEFAKLLAAEITRRAPRIATVERSLAKRKREQVYVDWMQNSRGKSLAAVYTARAKPAATVSMPLTWMQVEKGVKISDFTIRNVPALMQTTDDAWARFFDSGQRLKLT